MEKSRHPDLNNLFIITVVIGIVISDGATSYFRLSFPQTAVLYLTWPVLLGLFFRVLRKRLERREAKNE